MGNQYLSFTKEEVRTTIRFFIFQNVSNTEIHQKIAKVNDSHVISQKNISGRCTNFTSGQLSVEGEARSRQMSTSTAKTIEAFEKLLPSNRQLKDHFA